MTVKELMNELSSMPKDAQIYIETKEDIYYIDRVKLWVNSDDSKIYQCDIFAKEFK